MAAQSQAQLVDTIIRAVQADFTTDTSIPPDFVEDLLPQARAQAMEMVYNGYTITENDIAVRIPANKKIMGECYQDYTVTINRADVLPTDCYITATIPNVIYLDSSNDGYVWLGDVDTGLSFTKIKSPEHVSMLLKRGMLNQNRIGYVHDGNNALKVYGNMMLKTINAKLIYADPRDNDDFSPDNPYPISQQMSPLIVNLVKDMILNQIQGTVNDKVNNSEDQSGIKGMQPQGR